MATPYTPIVGTLAYVLSPDRRQTLLIHRNARADDQHLGKYNGLGGKMHRDEDAIACIQREVREEAGIECVELALRGTINWTGFGPAAEDWLGFIFRIDRFAGQPLQRNEEGELGWHPIDKLHELPMWYGDRHFLPLVFDDDPRCFHGYMPYEGERVLGWHYVRI
jgi:8-oxo-dGTP diphosphatase